LRLGSPSSRTTSGYVVLPFINFSAFSANVEIGGDAIEEKALCYFFGSATSCVAERFILLQPITSWAVTSISSRVKNLIIESRFVKHIDRSRYFTHYIVAITGGKLYKLRQQ
jgi:hypothetical protein